MLRMKIEPVLAHYCRSLPLNFQKSLFPVSVSK
jgi:hypothetical protein